MGHKVTTAIQLSETATATAAVAASRASRVTTGAPAATK